MPIHANSNQYILIIILYKIYQQTNLRLKPGTTLDMLLKSTSIKETDLNRYCFIQDDCFQTESKNLTSSQPFTIQSADFISGSITITPIRRLSQTEHNQLKFDRTSMFTIRSFVNDFYNSRLNEFITKDLDSKNKLTNFNMSYWVFCIS